MAAPRAAQRPLDPGLGRVAGIIGQPGESLGSRGLMGKAERSFRHWDAERERAVERVNLAHEEERKVKARTKSASRKDAETAVAHERARTRESMARVLWRVQEIGRSAATIERLLTGAPQPEESEGVLKERERISKLVCAYIQRAMERGSRSSRVTAAGMKLLRALDTGLTLEQIGLPDDEPDEPA